MGVSPYIKRLREKVGHEVLLLPAVTAIIIDEAGRVLLHRASDDGKWHTIGGAMEPGEEAADAVVREALEETGLIVQPVRIIAVQSSPVITYPNGDQTQYVGISFLCRAIGGRLHIADDESVELQYFAPDALPALSPHQLKRVQCAFAQVPEAFFELPRETDSPI